MAVFATVDRLYALLAAKLTGATGGVGKRVVQQLLGQGRVVRALVRDVGKARQLLVSGRLARTAQ